LQHDERHLQVPALHDSCAPINTVFLPKPNAQMNQMGINEAKAIPNGPMRSIRIIRIKKDVEA
jgi:hypothetical protein